ncbi:MAG TPA: hypothetical protein VF898_00670, partial [Chloroflexota bacterium]
QRCVHCRQIDAGSHPDVTVVERAEGKESIAILQVRELRDTASLRPFQGARKVYIIAGAEALTAPAADALLKTLEEPQRQVTIILLSPDATSLPETIVSRCRLMALQPVETERLADALASRSVSRDDAEKIARLAQGSVGWALRAAKQPKILEQQAESTARLSRVLDLGMEERLRLAEEMAADRKSRVSVRRSLEILLLLARDVLLLSQNQSPRFTPPELQETLEKQARRYRLEQISMYLDAIRTAMIRIDQNVDPRLVLEALFVRLP